MATIRWRHLWREGGGVETLEVGTGRAVGRIDCRAGPDPFELRYSVRWNGAWRPLALELRLRGRDPARIERIAEGWQVDGTVRADLAHCTDVDLWPTPFTNTLAIRRLEAAGRTDAVIRVAWIDGLLDTVAAREQRYTRVAGGWRFVALDDGFTADIVVDEAGLVVAYPDLFERVAEPDQSWMSRPSR